MLIPSEAQLWSPQDASLVHDDDTVSQQPECKTRTVCTDAQRGRQSIVETEARHSFVFVQAEQRHGELEYTSLFRFWPGFRENHVLNSNTSYLEHRSSRTMMFFHSMPENIEIEQHALSGAREPHDPSTCGEA